MNAINNKNFDILQQWASITNYDPNQSSFNLASCDYSFHRCGRTITNLNTNFDQSGTLSIVYLKHQYESILKQAKTSVFNMIVHPTEFDKYAKLWDELNSDYVSSLEQQLEASISKMLKSISGSDRLQGAQSECNSIVPYCISDIAQSLPNIKFEAYCGNQLDELNYIDSNIRVFNTLSECLLSISNSPNGIYTCYISEHKTSSGYFNIIMKSRSTIAGCHDRVDETYVGQHNSSRNGRWQEDKLTDIFPYTEILDFSNYDYLGYPDAHMINETTIPIKNLSDNSIIKLLFSLYLIKTKYSKYTIDVKDKVYVDSLKISKQSALNLLKKQDKSLMSLSESTLSMLNDQVFDINITSEDILSGCLSSKFDRNSNRNKSYRETGCFPNVNQELIDKFGKGFNLDIKPILNRTNAIESGNDRCTKLNAEFIGSKQVFELESYRQARYQLRNYILSNMSKSYDVIGGMDGIRSWFKQAVKDNKIKLMKLAVKYYQEIQLGTRSNYPYDSECIPVSTDLLINVKEYEYKNFNNSINSIVTDWRCPISGCACNVFVTFIPCHYSNLEALFGSIPDILTGWSMSGSNIYQCGNPILESTDPISFIESPFYWRSAYKPEYSKLFPGCKSFPFVFSVGFSKRGLNKALKDITIIDSLEE